MQQEILVRGGAKRQSTPRGPQCDPMPPAMGGETDTQPSDLRPVPDRSEPTDVLAGAPYATDLSFVNLFSAALLQLGGRLRDDLILQYKISTSSLLEAHGGYHHHYHLQRRAMETFEDLSQFVSAYCLGECSRPALALESGVGTISRETRIMDVRDRSQKPKG